MFELRRISIVRRLSALLLDAILLAVLATGGIYVISLICRYGEAESLASEYYNEWETFRKDYIPQVAEYYGFTYEEDGENYTITKDGEAVSLYDVAEILEQSGGNDPATAEAYAAYKGLTPADKVNMQYGYVFNLLFMMVSLGILFAYLILEFILPIIFKNGQTVGKKVFDVCLVRTDCVKIGNLSLFARTFLGKYAIETMFPILLVFLFFFGGTGLVSVILLIALTILNIVLFFATKNRTPIHDLLADTAAADMKLQMIFGSEEELIQKKTLGDNA